MFKYRNRFNYYESNFFLKLFKKLIKIMIIEIIIREIEVNKHRIKKYVINFIYFQKKMIRVYSSKRVFEKKFI